MEFLKIGYVLINEITVLSIQSLEQVLKVTSILFDLKYSISVYADSSLRHKPIVKEDKTLQHTVIRRNQAQALKN